MLFTEMEIRKELEEKFDCISKLDAIKYIKKEYGNYFSLKNIVAAYNSINKFNI